MTLIGWGLRAAHGGFRDGVEAGLRDLGLTFSQYAALAQVVDHEGQSVARLAALSRVTPQRMHQLIGQLEGKQLVVRKAHPDVERVLQTWPTDEGKRVLDTCEKRVQAIEDRLLQGIDGTQRDQLNALLKVMIENLQRPQEP